MVLSQINIFHLGLDSTCIYLFAYGYPFVSFASVAVDRAAPVEPAIASRHIVFPYQIVSASATHRRTTVESGVLGRVVGAASTRRTWSVNHKN